MKRLLLLALAALALVAPAAALAHPLGNFTTNRYSSVELAGDRIYVLYVLDLAEIPTFQQRGTVAALGRDAYAARVAGELRRKLDLRIGGRRLELEELGRTLAFPSGAGGLKVTRLEVVYTSGTIRSGDERLELLYRDGNYAERVGWKEIVIKGRNGAELVDASVPARSASRALRVYPQDLLSSPLDVTRATATFAPGAFTAPPPKLSSGEELEAPARTGSSSESGFAALIAEDGLGTGAILLSLLVAMFWGGAHAFSPGHGKAIVGAYLVGSRGKARHAAMLGLIVTVTHTIGVFALGLVTLALSEFFVPEQLYPWLNLVSALLVVAVGVGVLRWRIRDWFRNRAGKAAARRGHAHDHSHDHDHTHDHGHADDDGHAHDRGHEPHDHGHHHHGPGGHSHVPEPGSGMRGLVAVGISGGIIPCPTALVVLLAAISLHRVGYGLLLILAFSVGLAAVVTAIGLLAISAKRTFSRLSFNGPVIRALPAISAFIILGLGVAMIIRALPTLS